MKKQDCSIRLERKEERHTVEALVRETFWNVYRPGCLEHYVLHQMREHPDFLPELNFVLEKDGGIIGQNVFVRAAIAADDGRRLPIGSMGPISIAPEYQGQGYGRLLLDATLERARAAGLGALCFEGDIGFYGGSGFTFASRFGLRYPGLPESADASFFLCRELEPGYLRNVTGVYVPSGCYQVDEDAAEVFDRRFPAREKQQKDGQLF